MRLKADDPLRLFLEMLVVERGVAENTRLAYGRDLADARAFFTAQGTVLEDSDADGLRAYLHGLVARGMAPSSQARRLAALRRYFRFLLREGQRADDPCTHLAAPKQGRRLPKYLTEAEISALLAAIDGQKPHDRLRLTALLELLYAAGLRISELLTLTLDAIDWQDRVLRVRGKGDKERLVPFNDAAVRALDAYLEIRAVFLTGTRPNNRYVFPSRGASGHLTRQRVFQLLRALALSAGLDPARVSPHVVRHAFASHLLAGGVDLRVLQTLLGHSDIAATEIYTHVQPERYATALHQHHPLARSEPRAAPRPATAGNRPEGEPNP